MFIRNGIVALAAILASSTGALAAYDGDNNPVPGVQQQATFHGAFASTRMPVTTAPRRATRMMVIRIEIDGDGNRVFEQR